MVTRICEHHWRRCSFSPALCLCGLKGQAEDLEKEVLAWIGGRESGLGESQTQQNYSVPELQGPQIPAQTSQWEKAL